MASLISSRRPDSRRPDGGRPRGGLRLRATRPVEPVTPVAESPTGPPIGWPVAALAGGLVTAATGWVAWVGIAMLGWLSAEPGTFGGSVAVGTDLWLLSNGVSVRIGTIPVTLVPWGAVAVVAFLISRFAAFSARQVKDGQVVGPGVISMVVLTGYLLPVLVVGVFLGEPWQAPDHWAAVIVVLGLAAVFGASRELGPTSSKGDDPLGPPKNPISSKGDDPLGPPKNPVLLPRWPGWVRAVPRAVLSTQLVMLAAGAAAVVTALLRHQDRVTALSDALQPGVAGGIALLVGQLAFAPNFCVWAASYALGAGFTLGGGSVVAPAGSEIGILPGIPVFGALPAAGPGSVQLLWWLAAGVLAGAVAAWTVVRARPAARFDETSLLGGLAGGLGGLLFVAVAWAASGDLGTVRLADVGPRLGPLLVMATTTMGLAGMLTGLLLGLVRRRS